MFVICFFLVHEVFGGLSLKVVFWGKRMWLRLLKKTYEEKKLI